MKPVLLLAVLFIPGAISVDILESNPVQVNGTLTACAGQWISLFCSHSNVQSVTTQWMISTPLDCSATVTYNVMPATVQSTCTTVTIQGTAASMGDTSLNSTLVGTADVNMNGSIVECIAGNAISGTSSVGNISLYIVDPPLPPANISCENTANGLNVIWDGESPDGYNVTVYSGDMVVLTRFVTGNSTEVNNLLQPSQQYDISVRSRSAIGSCDGEPATVICETSDTIPTPTLVTMTTQPATFNRTSASAQSTMPTTDKSTEGLSEPPIVEIVVPIIIIIIIIFVGCVTIYIIYRLCKKKDDKKPANGIELVDGGGTKSKLIEHENAGGVEYAVVTQKSGNQPQNSNPDSSCQGPGPIQHESAPVTGDLYAVAEKKPKESPADATYSLPDKSRKNQGITYADVDTVAPRGGNKPIQQPPQTEYATVVN